MLVAVSQCPLSCIFKPFDHLLNLTFTDTTQTLVTSTQDIYVFPLI